MSVCSPYCLETKHEARAFVPSQVVPKKSAEIRLPEQDEFEALLTEDIVATAFGDVNEIQTNQVYSQKPPYSGVAGQLIGGTTYY